MADAASRTMGYIAEENLGNAARTTGSEYGQSNIMALHIGTYEHS
jgi:hypothetical protein